MIYLDVTSSCKSPMSTGVQRVVRGIYRSLQQAGAAVTPLVWDPALASYCELSPRERGFLETPFGRSGAPWADAEPGRRANPLPIWSKFARAVGHRLRRIDLPARLTAADALFVPEIFQDNRVEWLPALAGKTPARRVVVCHDAIAWRRPDITPAARQAGFEAYLDALSRFDRVIAVSHETAADLRDRWRAGSQPEAPVSVLGWPVDHGGDARPASLPQAANGHRPMALCVGTFEPRKNHLALLEAAGQLWTRGADFELALIGRTTTPWGTKVLAVVNALQAAGRPVRWLRHVDDETLRRAYAECAFTVFPSLIEGFGLPVLESLWHGRPCVCGANGALGEVSSGGGCWNVDQTRPAALAEGMERLLADPALYRRLRVEAAARPLDTWASYAGAVRPLLEGQAEVCSGSR